MAVYIVRVVLHNAKWEDYIKLHNEMGREGFSDEIISDDNVVYKLPDGEYTIVSALENSDILSKAKRAAASTQKTYAVLSTKSSGITWFNLEKVKK